MSEMEAANQKKSKKAKKAAVDRLPRVKIEKKHCKKQQGGTKLEPPTCTVCCDPIAVDSKGMFMPCGHVYHPDCLTPWLENNNSCPVCRFELPLEEADDPSDK
jgi:E3 ubiquitin-protein ligase RNF115/126